MPTLIGDEIRRHRLRANMTSKRLADEILLSEQYLSDIQKGRRLPSIDTLLTICNVFPDADSGRWLWLLLRDIWGDAAFNVMWTAAQPGPRVDGGGEGA